jgi:hypothetical protein
MILIDDKKTVIAGEALKVMVELALVVDRLALELEGKKGLASDYDELIDRFINLVYRIKKSRKGKADVLPQEILDNNSIKDLFPEEFFEVFGNMPGESNNSSSFNTSKSSKEMLEEAMAKLNKAKKNKNKKKKKKDSKKDSKKD